MNENEHVEIPSWVGVIVVAAGGACLLTAGRKR